MPDRPFLTVGLIAKSDDPQVADTLRHLCAFLQRRGRTVLLDDAAAVEFGAHDLEIVSRKVLGARCDLAIIVGGDGTLLNAARSLADDGVPLLGINRGRLGFLVDVSPARMLADLERIFDGEYQIDDRILLHAHVERDGACISRSDALNDVVVHKWDIGRMIRLDTYIDGRFVNTLRSDGLIVATTTGSTAYALSGGGPILYPALHALVLVPICPHTLSNRPLVIDAGSKIEIVINDTAQAQVTCDGQINLGVNSQDHIHIKRKERTVRLIHPPGHDYFEILRAKLRWGNDLHAPGE